MDTNNPKPTQTGLGEAAAVDVLRGWLDQFGGNQRIPQVLDLLAEETAIQMQKGHPAPEFDADTLRRFFYEKFGGRIPDAPASKWLPSAQVQRWWTHRQGTLEQACRDAALEWVPVLIRQQGGGRGNLTQYRLDFHPLPSLEDLAGGGR